jgi:hypothetical protein
VGPACIAVDGEGCEEMSVKQIIYQLGACTPMNVLVGLLQKLQFGGLLDTHPGVQRQNPIGRQPLLQTLKSGLFLAQFLSLSSLSREALHFLLLFQNQCFIVVLILIPIFLILFLFRSRPPHSRSSISIMSFLLQTLAIGAGATGALYVACPQCASSLWTKRSTSAADVSPIVPFGGALIVLGSVLYVAKPTPETFDALGKALVVAGGVSAYWGNKYSDNVNTNMAYAWAAATVGLGAYFVLNAKTL